MVQHQTKDEFSSLLICSINESELLRTPIAALHSETQCVQVDLTSSTHSDRKPSQVSIITPISYRDESGLASKSWSEYSVVSVLGEGSYGKVYKVIRKNSNLKRESGEPKSAASTFAK